MNENCTPFLRVGNLSGKRDEKIYIKKEISKNIYLNPNNIAISFDGTPGIVRIGMEGAYSSGIRKVVIKNHDKITQNYLYYLLKSEHIQNIIKAYSKGTTILHASSAIENFEFILPPITILLDFEKKVAPMTDYILLQTNEIKLLENMRNILLPKLISDEIDVNNVDIKRLEG
jgi:type I restriction enzyme S subunit